jgi:hypothetical protein
MLRSEVSSRNASAAHAFELIIDFTARLMRRHVAAEAVLAKAESENKRLREEGILGRETAYRRRDAAEAALATVEKERDGLREALIDIQGCSDHFYTEGGDGIAMHLPPELRPWAGPLRFIFETVHQAIATPSEESPR